MSPTPQHRSDGQLLSKELSSSLQHQNYITMDPEEKRQGTIPSLTAAIKPWTSSFPSALSSRTWKALQAASITLLTVYILYSMNLFTILPISISAPTLSTSSTATTPFSWSAIPATTSKITWHPCYSIYNCTRISLPLDYNNTSNPSHITIPLIRLTATSSNNTTTPYLGPVFFNPGGPGGSGIYAMLHRGPLLHSIVGPNHDLISFDPRGVGLSEPVVDCWGFEFTAKMWALRGEEVGDANNASVYNAYARQVAYSRRCATAPGMLGSVTANASSEEHPLLSYMSTASVARDLAEILKLMGKQNLKNWGFSYGTYLGGVFASLWPEKVDRMVLDGSVHFGEWQANRHMSFARDADEVMDKFYEYCVRNESSALHKEGQDTTQIEARVDGILESLKRRPIVTDAEVVVEGVPEIVTYSMVQRVISSTLYQPRKMFPQLALILKGLEDGDAGALVDYYSTKAKPLSLCHDDPRHKKKSSIRSAVELDIHPFMKPVYPFDPPSEDYNIPEATFDATSAVLCADGGPVNSTLSSAISAMNAMMALSKASGAVNAVTWLDCLGWKIQAKDRFTGKFEGNTSHPILFVANEWDNVTPGYNAELNARGFEGARVVILKGGLGHTSLSTPSKELNKYIYDYFHTGGLPKGDAHPDEPFP